MALAQAGVQVLNGSATLLVLDAGDPMVRTSFDKIHEALSSCWEFEACCEGLWLVQQERAKLVRLQKWSAVEAPASRLTRSL